MPTISMPHTYTHMGIPAEDVRAFVFGSEYGLITRALVTFRFPSFTALLDVMLATLANARCNAVVRYVTLASITGEWDPELKRGPPRTKSLVLAITPTTGDPIDIEWLRQYVTAEVITRELTGDFGITLHNNL
jgi:hypothetical protein